jgi:hypothetical protein
MLQTIITVARQAHIAFTHLHNDERGDNENLGRMLMLALVLIPIVILIATMGGTIYDAAAEQWRVLSTSTTGAAGSGLSP